MVARYGRILPVSITAILLVGCASFTQFTSLRDDSVPAGETRPSVVTWKLHVIDYTKEALNTVPVFEMSLGGDEISSKKCEWTETDAAATYECLYVVRTEQPIFNPWEIRIPMVHGNIWWKDVRFLEIPPGRSWTIDPESLQFIGDFVVEIHGIEPGTAAGSWSITYAFAIENGQKNLDAARARFEREFPITYESYGRTMNLAQ